MINKFIIVYNNIPSAVLEKLHLFIKDISIYYSITNLVHPVILFSTYALLDDIKEETLNITSGIQNFILVITPKSNSANIISSDIMEEFKAYKGKTFELDINIILDKINVSGENSLNIAERGYLKSYEYW